MLSSKAIKWIITGASLSEPHTNQYYEKIAVFMYVCMYVCLYVRSDMSATCSLAMRIIIAVKIINVGCANSKRRSPKDAARVQLE